MPNIFYMDYDLGVNGTTDTPLGWWSGVVTVVGGTAPVAGETMTGAPSGATAKLTIAPSAWTGAVTCYFYGKSGTFGVEAVSFTGGGTGTIAADLIYCAWKDITAGPTAPRIAPLDITRVAKSPDPTSLGCNGVWTDAPDTLPTSLNIESSTNAAPIEITITGHPYVTGDCVYAQAHTTNLTANGTWSITKTGANTFTLDDSTGIGVGGATGNCTVINWHCVKLATAQTKTVDRCEQAWTAVTGLITVLNATPTNGGSGYAVNDTFNITTGGTGAIGIVTTVSVTVVTGVAIVTGGNGGYTTGTGKATTKIIGAGNDALTVNITTVASAVVTATAVATDGKSGGYCMKIAAPTGVLKGSKLAYLAISPGTLASYQKLSFWIKNSAAITAGQWRVVLCSGATGETIVDEFLITAIPSTARWLPLNIAKTGGGNLGASTASIAIYADTVAPSSASNVIVDNFIACTTSGLNLQSLISKNSAAQGGTEGFYGIQSISEDGKVIRLDNNTNTLANANITTRGGGYSGTSETVPAYKRETTKTSLASSSSTQVQAIQDSGTSGNNIEFQAGFDPVTNLQNGETFFDGSNGNGYGIYLSAKNFITLNYFNAFRYNYAFSLSGNSNIIQTLSNSNNNTTFGIYLTGNNCEIQTISNINNNNYNGLYLGTATSRNTFTLISNSNNNTYDGVELTATAHNNNFITISNLNNNLNYGIISASSNNNIKTLSNSNKNTYGVYFSTSFLNTIKTLSTSGNSTAGIFNDVGRNYINNALIAESTEVAGFTNFANSRVFSQNHDQTENNHRIFTDGGTINSQVATRHTASGIAWQFTITSANRSASYPLDLSVMKVAVAANAVVTIKAWLKKDDSTAIGMKLIYRGGQISGLPNDVSVTKANDTDWEELTLTLDSPTSSGVIEIEAHCFYITGNSNGYIDDISCSQA